MKATGMTNLNGDNNVMFGMTIPIGRKRSDKVHGVVLHSNSNIQGMMLMWFTFFSNV